MRFLIVFIFVLSISATAYSTNSSSISLSALQMEQLEQEAQMTERLAQAQQAVWNIISFDICSGGAGTGFFVSPGHIVTNWHVIFGQDMDSMLLQREGSDRVLSVKRLVSVSALHDLALLEVEEDSLPHLTVREDIISDEEELFSIGYSVREYIVSEDIVSDEEELFPSGIVGYTLKTSSLKDFENDYYTYFSVNRTNLAGNSGSPVLDTNSKVVGVLARGINNYAGMIKGSILRDFINGDIGLSCEGLFPRSCITF